LDTNSAPNLVLGIDTGGTYTDGVLLEYESRRVLASHKSLTTKRDFSIGIEEVIAGIQIEDPSAIRMVSISTTLATNAIAEGKGKRVALLLIGYDPDLLSRFKLDGRLATPNYYFFDGGHDLYGREKKPLDLSGILARVVELRGKVDAIAVSAYFSPLNPEHENRAYNAISSPPSLARWSAPRRRPSTPHSWPCCRILSLPSGGPWSGGRSTRPSWSSVATAR
jgi:N-methylhydantoinase A/oxoprolinase/acetone carboxylase beta subunit